MKILNLLLVEDDKQDQETCRDSVARYIEEKGRPIALTICSTSTEAITQLASNSPCDGAIIDMKLSAAADGGNQITEAISQSFLRIPTIIFTGTPDSVSAKYKHVGVFKKGETTYEKIIDILWDIHHTGLSNILGGKGLIEGALAKVFRENMLPQMPAWVKYSEKNSILAEKALLRHTLSHLLSSLDEDSEHFFPEEVYIHPPIEMILRTGNILKNADSKYFIVLNPACDLVLRTNKKPKTDRILIAEIDDQGIYEQTLGMIKSKSFDEIKRISKCQHHKDESECYKSALKSHDETLRSNSMRFYNNTYSAYFHWLPKTAFFRGGFINFRKLTTIPTNDFPALKLALETQISPLFIKDIISRFSAYYARQGQPDIDYSAV